MQLNYSVLYSLLLALGRIASAAPIRRSGFNLPASQRVFLGDPVPAIDHQANEDSNGIFNDDDYDDTYYDELGEMEDDLYFDDFDAFDEIYSLLEGDVDDEDYGDDIDSQNHYCSYEDIDGEGGCDSYVDVEDYTDEDYYNGDNEDDNDDDDLDHDCGDDDDTTEDDSGVDDGDNDDDNDCDDDNDDNDKVAHYMSLFRGRTGMQELHDASLLALALATRILASRYDMPVDDKTV